MTDATEELAALDALTPAQRRATVALTVWCDRGRCTFARVHRRAAGLLLVYLGAVRPAERGLLPRDADRRGAQWLQDRSAQVFSNCACDPSMVTLDLDALAAAVAVGRTDTRAAEVRGRPGAD